MCSQYGNPLVSIIMNCYNSDRYLKEAIDSVYAQTYQNWEIIFWDNQSVDSSAKIANTYDEKLKYYYADEFLPLGAARNKALEKASGEWIAFLDCDDLWDKNKLVVQIETAKRNPNAKFIYSNFYRRYERKNRKTVALRKNQPSGDIFSHALISYNIGILTVLIKREVLEKLEEKFDEKLNIAEERDLFMRVLLNSYAVYIDIPLATYRIHADMTSERIRYMGPVEVDYVLNKLQKFDYEGRYKKEFEFADIANDRLQAEVFILQGNLVEAREVMQSIKSKRFVYFIIYAITFCPKPLAKGIHCILRSFYSRFIK